MNEKKYCSVDENSAHLTALIDFLYNEVVSSGGDGDALWYSIFYDVKDLLPLIQTYNNILKYPWKVTYHEDENYINWGEHQEGIIITNNENHYLNAPSWQQILIKY